MNFGESVREIVSNSCGKDLRSARSRTPLPGIDSPVVQRRLATNLERSFDIVLSPEDVSNLKTVRAVLQCVRLRRWERDVAEHECGREKRPPTPAPQAAVSASAGAFHDRFVRYTPPASPPMPLPAAPSFAIRKS